MPIADISVHAAQLAVAIIFNGCFFSTKTSEGMRVVHELRHLLHGGAGRGAGHGKGWGGVD